MTNRDWPKISIVTPSFNQGGYIEETIQSVITQGYSNLEYFVIDGGSTDNSPDIIKGYENQLTTWCSEADQGQYDAINKGFAHSTGEIMAWINSDDKYHPDALKNVAEIFSTYPEIEWLTSVTCLTMNGDGYGIKRDHLKGFTKGSFYRGRNGGISGFHSHFIVQESTFWRRSLWERSGAYIDSNMKLAGDFELWNRFWRHANLYSTTASLGIFRKHESQKTAIRLPEYFSEALQVLKDEGANLPSRFEVGLFAGIQKASKALLQTQGRVSFKSGLILRAWLRKRVGYPYTDKLQSWEALFVDFNLESKCWEIHTEEIQ